MVPYTKDSFFFWLIYLVQLLSACLGSWKDLYQTIFCFYSLKSNFKIFCLFFWVFLFIFSIFTLIFPTVTASTVLFYSMKTSIFSTNVASLIAETSVFNDLHGFVSAYFQTMLLLLNWLVNFFGVWRCLCLLTFSSISTSFCNKICVYIS